MDVRASPLFGPLMCKPSELFPRIWTEVVPFQIAPSRSNLSIYLFVTCWSILSNNMPANITHDPKFVRWNLPLYRIITTFESFQSRLACFELAAGSIIYDSLLPAPHKQNLKLKCVQLTEGRIRRLKATVTSLASSHVYHSEVRKLN